MTNSTLTSSEMHQLIGNGKNAGLSFSSEWSYSPLYGTWANGSVETISRSSNGGNGACDHYRGYKVASGKATSGVYLSHNAIIPIAVTGEFFAAIWDGGSFGRIVSQSMSRGNYIVALGVTEENFAFAKDYLCAVKRQRSLYTISTLPSDRDYYSDDRWEHFQSCDYRWEQLERTAVQDGVMTISSDNKIVTVYHVAGYTEVFRNDVPRFELWKLEQAFKKECHPTLGLYSFSQEVRTWIRQNIYGESRNSRSAVYPTVNPKQSGACGALLRRVRKDLSHA